MDAALSSTELAKKELFEELTVGSVNVLRVRALCRDYPGIIATTGLRIRIWTLLLLGPEYKINVDENRDIKMPDKGCEEQQVLEADVRRTRSEVEGFRSTTWRNAVQSMLQHFCLSHSIQYKQGMNEVLAPFMFIHPPPKGSAVPYVLFEAFLFRYLERHLCLDDSSFLFKAFRLFHVLLLYFDPQLALHLKDQDFPPELYSPQWFLTLYSRTLPLLHTLRLWDMIIAVDDPAFTFFIGLCLLRRRRDKLLLADTDCIPEIIQDLGFQGEEDIDSVVSEAVSYYKRTPRCLSRNLRLCCVATTQLSSAPVSRAKSVNNKDDLSSLYTIPGEREFDEKEKEGRASTMQDQTMAVQAARSCLMLNAKELVAALLSAANPSETNTNTSNTQVNRQTSVLGSGAGAGAGDGSSSSGIGGSTGNGNGNGSGSTGPDISAGGIWGGLEGGGVGSDLQQFVLVDVRSASDIETSGGGHLSCAVRLDPEFLDRPDTFAIWLQHLDCMRGCNICIVDIPPVLAPCSKTLWRRLLLGEGDGSGKNRGFLGGASPAKSSPASGDAAGFRDLESTHAAAEKAAVADDSVRPAVRLALALQRAGFPYVCVLDEGFPKFIEELTAIAGSLEPIVLNHDPNKWEKFLISSGRLAPSRRPSLLKPIKSEIDFKNSNLEQMGMKAMTLHPPGPGDHDSKHRLGPRITVKKKDPLTELEVAQMAYLVAMRLGHKHMELMLLNRVNEVIEKEKKKQPVDMDENGMIDSTSDW